MKTRMRAANDNPGGGSSVALPAVTAAPVAAEARGPSVLERAVARVAQRGADIGGGLAFAALLAASIAIRAWPV